MQAGAMKMKCMADGGLVGAIKGMFGAKAATPAPTPAPKPAQTAISDYAGMGAMKRREAAAGMKHGGKVKGPGTGTSDSVPAMLSKGEHVMPADSVKKIGAHVLEAMRKATHTPTAKPKKGHGAIRKMASGGLVEDKAVFGLYPQVTGGSKLATHATDNALRTGVVATGPSTFAPAAPVTPIQQALPAGVAPSTAGAGRGTVSPPPALPTAPAPIAAPTPAMPGTPAAVAASAAPTAVTSPIPGSVQVDGYNAAGKANSFTDGVQPGLGARGPISSQNMGAAQALSDRYGAEARSTLASQQYKQQEADANRTNASQGFGTGTPMTPRDLVMAQLSRGKLTAKGAGVLTDLARTDAQGAISAQANKLAQDRLGVEKTTASADARLKGAQATTAEGVIAAQARLAAAKTTEEVKAATENLRVVQGKEHANRFTVIPGGQTIDPATGQPLREPSQVLDNQTGKIVPTGAQGAAKNIAADPAALAIKNDTKLSRDEKVKRLQAMGY